MKRVIIVETHVAPCTFCVKRRRKHAKRSHQGCIVLDSRREKFIFCVK